MSPLGKKIVAPPKKDERPEWSRVSGARLGTWRHRDPPHRIKFEPTAGEQAAASLEDAARAARKAAAP